MSMEGIVITRSFGPLMSSKHIALNAGVSSRLITTYKWMRKDEMKHGEHYVYADEVWEELPQTITVNMNRPLYTFKGIAFLLDKIKNKQAKEFRQQIINHLNQIQ